MIIISYLLVTLPISLLLINCLFASYSSTYYGIAFFSDFKDWKSKSEILNFIVPLIFLLITFLVINNYQEKINAYELVSSNILLLGITVVMATIFWEKRNQFKDWRNVEVIDNNNALSFYRNFHHYSFSEETYNDGKNKPSILVQHSNLPIKLIQFDSKSKDKSNISNKVNVIDNFIALLNVKNNNLAKNILKQLFLNGILDENYYWKGGKQGLRSCREFAILYIILREQKVQGMNLIKIRYFHFFKTLLKNETFGESTFYNNIFKLSNISNDHDISFEEASFYDELKRIIPPLC